MKVALLADIHGYLPELEPCDLAIIAGDICPTNDHSNAFQLSWLTTNFKHWLGDQPAGKIIGIAGNHDFIFEDAARLDGYSAKWLRHDLPWTYLHDSGTEYEGYKIWGSPWQPWFCDWAFNLPRGSELADKWALIPNDTEILITHGPPRGILDIEGFQKTSQGCDDLKERVDRLDNLHLHVFGHIHHSFGQALGEEDDRLFVNASYVDEGYNPRPDAPVYITLPDK